MLHLTERECWEQAFVRLFEAVDLCVAHTSRIKRIKSRVALFQQLFVHHDSHVELTIHEVGIP